MKLFPRSTDNNIIRTAVFVSSDKDTVVPFNLVVYRLIFVKVASIKFHKNSSSVTSGDSFGQTDGLT